jgi:hypothetical protein
MYALASYGIPHLFIPLNMHGELKQKPHMRWLKMRSAQEKLLQQQKLKACIVLPALADILLGKGKPIQQHKGNAHLHHLVDSNVPLYEGYSNNEDKAVLTQRLAGEAKAIGGRFLKQDEKGVWMEVDDNTARTKVSKLFRARRKMVLDKIARKESIKSDGKEISDDSSPMPAHVI